MFMIELGTVITAGGKLHAREAVYSMRDAAMQVSVIVGPSLDISGPNHLMPIVHSQHPE